MSFNDKTHFVLSLKGKKTIVFTNGCFDLIHRGHLYYLQEAKSLGDYLIVGLNSDKSVNRLKGHQRPINNESDRKYFLESLRSVDAVEIFDEDTPERLIKEIAPDILVKGGDYTIESIVGARFVLESGGKVEVLSFIDGYSSTNLIKKIKNL